MSASVRKQLEDRSSKVVGVLSSRVTTLSPACTESGVRLRRRCSRRPGHQYDVLRDLCAEATETHDQSAARGQTTLGLVSEYVELSTVEPLVHLHRRRVRGPEVRYGRAWLGVYCFNTSMHPWGERAAGEVSRERRSEEALPGLRTSHCVLLQLLQFISREGGLDSQKKQLLCASWS